MVGIVQKRADRINTDIDKTLAPNELLNVSRDFHIWHTHSIMALATISALL
jgi:hypothetical protein